jgi:hypothetical protein
MVIKVIVDMDPIYTAELLTRPALYIKGKVNKKNCSQQKMTECQNPERQQTNMVEGMKNGTM